MSAAVADGRTAGARHGPGAARGRAGLRIAMVDPSLFTVPYDRALLRGLADAGHEVRLHGRAAGRDDAADGLAVEGDFYRIASLPAVAALPRAARLAIKGLDHVRSMLALRARMRAERPDVIHFQWLALPAIDRRLLAGLRAVAPLVLTVHDTNPFNGDPSAALQSRGFAACLAGFDRLIVHTRQGRERLLALGLPSARISVLPHGLLDALPPAPAALDASGGLTFLLFGKIKPYKGLDVLVEAFARLPGPLRDRARLRVVGKPYMPLGPLLARAAALGVGDRLAVETRFVADDEVGGLFGPDVVAVFPYREIEASGVLPFALAHGRPVVASALGGFAETIEDGVQGLLVAPGDADALSRAMARMIGDAGFAGACGAAARRLAETVPDWSVIAARTAAVYEAARAEAGVGRAGAAGARARGGR